MGTCCKHKAVLVLVYQEMPPRSCRNGPNKNRVVLHRSRSRSRSRSHSGKGYSRKAELLRYSQRLRESARSSDASTPVPLNNHQSTDKPVALQKKQKRTGQPACFGMFMRSSTKDGKKKRRPSGRKMDDVMKSFKVHKKKSFWDKLLHAVKKRIYV